jgi:hypothetical protein
MKTAQPGDLVKVVSGIHKGARGHLAEVPGTLNQYFRVRGIVGYAFTASELQRIPDSRAARLWPFMLAIAALAGLAWMVRP